MKRIKWKCTVCGEIIEQNDVPKICPVCGVDSKYFVKIEEEMSDSKFDSEENIIIIGASGAGMAAAMEIRKRNSICSITIVSKEDVLGYYRPQLSKMLSKDIPIDSIKIKDNLWLDENNIKIILNKDVIKIDDENKNIILDDNKKLNYDKLIIATGAECFMPPIKGNDKQGVFTLRYLKDTFDIKDYAKDKKTAVVIGGGILGLETAAELKNMGLSVTILEMSDRILSRQLDLEASEILEKIVEKAGVKFRKGVTTKEILGDNKVNKILLGDDETLDADIVVVSAGVRANSNITEGTNINVDRAIVVDSKMKTNVDNIYACGDCAQHDEINYALWSEAIEQGKIAGINCIGEEVDYKTIIPSTTLNAFNSSIFSIGEIILNPDDNYQVYEMKTRKPDFYQKVFFKNDKFIGGILIGDTSKTVDLINGFENSITMDEMILRLESNII
jgi:NADH oxidase (H2O-forming)